MSLSTLQLVNIILPLITLPYVIRVLGFENYGVVVFASSLIAYFIPITDYSFRVTATREIAVFKHSTKRMSIIYSNVIMVKLLFLLISILIITAVILLYPPFFEERLVFFLSATVLLGHALFPEWFFQGIEKMKVITLLNFGVKIFFTISVFVCITEKEDYWLYPMLQGAGFLVAGLIGQFILVRSYKLKFYFLKPRRVLQSVKTNFPIFINQFFPTLYNNTSTFLLGLFVNISLVGIYDAIKKVIDVCGMVVGIISRVFFPFLNRRKGAFNKFSKLILWSGFMLSILPIIFYKLIFWYLDIQHKDAFIVLILLSLSTFGLTMYNCFGLNYFIVKREDRMVMKSTMLASLISLVVAFPMIYYFNIIGAGFNLLFARFAMGGYLWYNWRRYE